MSGLCNASPLLMHQIWGMFLHEGRVQISVKCRMDSVWPWRNPCIIEDSRAGLCDSGGHYWWTGEQAGRGTRLLPRQKGLTWVTLSRPEHEVRPRMIQSRGQCPGAVRSTPVRQEGGLHEKIGFQGWLPLPRAGYSVLTLAFLSSIPWTSTVHTVPEMRKHKPLFLATPKCLELVSAI